MKYVFEYTYEEIAHCLKSTVDIIKKRMPYIKEKIKDYYNEMYMK